MSPVRSFGILLVFGFLGIPATALPAETGAVSQVTVYPPAFFAAVQPTSAYDMLTVLPGYVFTESDSDVRGFTGAVGNVLIDGSRPAGKQESLESILRRIPAAAVERIEVIRAGAPGIDMQGQTVLANVVRRREAQARGMIEAESAFYERGFRAPRLAGEISRRSAREIGRRFSANSTLPIALNQGKSAYCWNTTPTSGSGPATALPSMRIEPEEISTKPAIAFSRVDLPQPEGPISAVKDPGSRSRLVGASALISRPRALKRMDTSAMSTRPFSAWVPAAAFMSAAPSARACG